MLFIVPYPKDRAPSQRLKFEQYLDYFGRNGIEYTFRSFVTPQFWDILYKKGKYLRKVFWTIIGYLRRFTDVIRAFHHDVVYIHLEAAPFGPPILEWLFYKMGKPIIYDIDDLIYLPQPSEAHRFIQILKNPDKVPKIIKWSDKVIVVTRYLARYTSRFNPNVLYVPPTINTDAYKPVQKSVHNSVCIGWTGSHSTVKYVRLMAPVLKKLQDKYGVRIKVVGDKNFTLPGVKIEAKDWKLEDEIKDIQDMDIGLYPLPKTEWVLGKGGLKALQYMGMGIPTVCTAYGAALEIIKNGRNGFLADTDEDWIKKLTMLIKNARLRKSIGLSGRETVIESYSITAYKEVMLSVFDEYRKLKLLQIITDLDIGGTEKMLAELIDGLDKRNYSTSVCSIKTFGPVAKELHSIKNLKAFSLNTRFKFDIRALFKLYLMLKRTKPDIVQTYLYFDNILGGIVAKLAGVKHIIMGYRAANPYEPRLRAVMENFFMKSVADHVVSNSYAGKNILVQRGVPPEKIHVIHNAKHLKNFMNVTMSNETKARLGISAKDKVVTIVAKLREQKGHVYFLRAIKQIIHKYKDFAVLIVGDGPLKASLEAYAKKLGIATHIRFLGDREDVNEILALTDIFVMPSLWEGFSGAIIEAMAMKLPVIATDVGDTKYLVKDGVTGYLVRPKDWQALAEKTIGLLNHVSLSMAFGRNGYSHVKKFLKREKMVRSYEGVYGHCVFH